MDAVVQPRVADVAVVGYGPVGATVANLLGQAGLDVVVVERDPSPYPRARAISTDEEVLRIWQQVGLAEELKSDMLGGLPITFVSAAGRTFIDVQWSRRGHGHPPQMFIYQPALEQTLRSGVERFANVEVLLEHEAGAVRQNPAGVELDVADLQSGATQTIHASYLLACDGGSSPVRTQLGIPYEGRTYQDQWVVIDTKVKVPWPEVNRLRFHCDPARPAVDCPTPLDHHRWEFPVLPGESAEEVSSESRIWEMLGRYGITDANVKLLRTAVYTHHVRFSSRWQDGRVFLLGDAAHAMPPWVGQGMCAGVRDAHNLSWKLAAVLRGGADPSLLTTYEPERKPHLKKVTANAVFVGRVITERRRWLAAIRNALGIVVKAPVVQRHLERNYWMPEADYSEGLVAGERTPVTGLHARQPYVKALGAGRARLDDLLGTNWAVLLRPEARQRLEGDLRPWGDSGASVLELALAGQPTEQRIVDEDGLLLSWMAEHDVDALVLRPDQFIYAATAAGVGRLPVPPPLLGTAPQHASILEEETR